MLEPFIKYLILHKKACIPGVGVFEIARQPGKYHFNNREFIAPSYEVTFKRNNEPADRKFYEFLQHEGGSDGVTALRQFNDFAYAMSEDLYQKRTIDLQVLGQISVDKSGEIVFDSPDQLEGFFPEVRAEILTSPVKTSEAVKERKTEPKVIKLKASKPVKKVAVAGEESTEIIRKDYWWVIAIALAVMSIAAIVFYYVNNPQV